MEGDASLRLTDREIAQTFADPQLAAIFPPVMTLEQASAMVQVPVGTLRDWRQRGRLAGLLT